MDTEVVSRQPVVINAASALVCPVPHRGVDFHMALVYGHERIDIQRVSIDHKAGFGSVPV
jgi:hypothetical protein